MNVAMKFLAIAALAATSATSAVGCALPTEDEPSGSTGDGLTQVPAARDGSGGVSISVQPNTILLKLDNKSVTYLGGNSVSVCERSADPSLLRKIRSMTSATGAHLVLQHPDGRFEPRTSNLPKRDNDVSICGHSAAYTFQFQQDPDGGFLQDVDLSSAFMNGIATERFSCEGGFFKLGKTNLDIKGFRVENGVVMQPAVSLAWSGQSSAGGRTRCTARKTSKHFAMAGVIPVYFELSLGVSLLFEVSKATVVGGKIGTEGGSLETDDMKFSVTPQIELGATFYGLVGGYVGIDFPITMTPRAPCSPEVEMNVVLKAGLQAGLLGFGKLPITKALAVEASSSVLGPFTLAESRCKS